MSEQIDHPRHYNLGRIEVVDFVEDQKLDFFRGSIIKYVVRAGHKTPDALVDLKKAKWYLDYYIKKIEEGQQAT